MSSYNLPPAEKLQHDLHEIGQRVKHHEDNVKYYKALQSKLEKSIVIMQVALEKYDESSFSTRVNKNTDDVKREEETMGHILKQEGSAAALLHSKKIKGKVLSSEHSLTKDVVGIVATLGKVEDENLSRLLAEYLGPEKMLAVVCKTYEGVKALEAYNEEGLIDKNTGLHASADSIGGSLASRFDVICLERMRPYAGDFMADDPQRRLSLHNPRLPNGDLPPGFLGFAVNMIAIDNTNLYCVSKDWQGLRETLFYNLFLNLQVYRKREDMMKAFLCINTGAISLDGGIIRTPGAFSLSHHRGDIGVRFLNGSESLNISGIYFETKNEMIKVQRELDRISGDLRREQILFDRARLNYKKRKSEFFKFPAESSSHMPQMDHFPKRSMTASYGREKSKKQTEEEIVEKEVVIEESKNEEKHGAIVHETEVTEEDDDGGDDDDVEDGDDSFEDKEAAPPKRVELGIFEYDLYERGNNHVSKHLKLKIDRGILKCKQYTSKLLRWDLALESRAMMDYVTKSCLHPLRVSSYRSANRVLISAFVERWHPETTSFHMPFGEMTITLDDVHNLLELPIKGQPMRGSRVNNSEMAKWVSELLGIGIVKVQSELRKNKCNALRTQWLIDNLSANGVERCDVEPVQAARGYLLVLLGCTLFQDRSGDKVRTKYLHFLEDMDNLSKWAWGAGTLAYLYRMLGKASTFPAKAICGYLTLVEAWIYEYFFGLRPGEEYVVSLGELRTKRWKGVTQFSEKNAFRYMKNLRIELDVLTKDDVNWNPYKMMDGKRRGELDDVVWFFGCLSLYNITEPYQPNRVVRQFGRIQDKPCAPICPIFSRRNQANGYVARYDCRDIAFLNYMDYVLDEDDRGEHTQINGKCTREYEEWYTSVALLNLNVQISQDLFGQTKSNERDTIHNEIELVECYIAKEVKDDQTSFY